MSIDSILGILERRCYCSRAKVWEFDAEEDILKFESTSFFLKIASIIFDLPMMQPKIFQKLKNLLIY